MWSSLGLIWFIPFVASLDSPNIIFMLFDDLGYADISATGAEYETPNLDDLYADSIHVEAHYTGVLCSPSRSQILTGRYAWNMGLSKLHAFGYCQISAFPTALPTIGTLLKEYTNYDTYALGKWHVGYSTYDHTPLNQLFFVFVSIFNKFTFIILNL